MTNELKQQEIERLSVEEKEVIDLEQLITDGVNAKIPIEITYNNKTFGVMVRPLTNVEWNNALQKSIHNKKTTNEVELLKIGLYKTDGTKFPAELIEQIPAGISSELMKKIAEISGIKLNTKENMELVKEMMGF